MDKDKTIQLANNQQLVLPENSDQLLDQKKLLALITEQLRMYSELPAEFQKEHRLIVEAEDRTIFIDLARATIEVKPPSVSITVEPNNP